MPGYACQLPSWSAPRTTTSSMRSNSATRRITNHPGREGSRTRAPRRPPRARATPPTAQGLDPLPDPLPASRHTRRLKEPWRVAASAIRPNRLHSEPARQRSRPRRAAQPVGASPPHWLPPILDSGVPDSGVPGSTGRRIDEPAPGSRMTSPLEPPRTLLGRGSWRESARVATSSRMDVTWVDVFGLGLLAAIGSRSRCSSVSSRSAPARLETNR